jgi:hypothetical protein
VRNVPFEDHKPHIIVTAARGQEYNIKYLLKTPRIKYLLFDYVDGDQSIDVALRVPF